MHAQVCWLQMLKTDLIDVRPAKAKRPARHPFSNSTSGSSNSTWSTSTDSSKSTAASSSFESCVSHPLDIVSYPLDTASYRRHLHSYPVMVEDEEDDDWSCEGTLCHQWVEYMPLDLRLDLNNRCFYLSLYESQSCVHLSNTSKLFAYKHQ